MNNFWLAWNDYASYENNVQLLFNRFWCFLIQFSHNYNAQLRLAIEGYSLGLNEHKEKPEENFIRLCRKDNA